MQSASLQLPRGALLSWGLPSILAPKGQSEVGSGHCQPPCLRSTCGFLGAQPCSAALGAECGQSAYSFIGALATSRNQEGNMGGVGAAGAQSLESQVLTLATSNRLKVTQPARG